MTTTPDTTRTVKVHSRLAEIRAREEAATPGHWGTCYDGQGTYTVQAQPRLIPAEGNVNAGTVATLVGEHGDSQTYANARFTAHAREDVPFLLDLVAELGGLVENLRRGTGRQVEPIQDSFPEGAAVVRLKAALAQFRAQAQDNPLADDLDTAIRFMEFTRQDIRQLRKAWAAITGCLIKQDRNQRLTDEDLEGIPASHRKLLRAIQERNNQGGGE
jgi:hypothetical protein